jgi:hypothetical protein
MYFAPPARTRSSPAMGHPLSFSQGIAGSLDAQ